jgi:hypothetical protein
VTSWRSLIAIIALAASACSGTSRPPPRSRLTPKQIFEKSESAIVRIEAGHEKVGTGFAVEPGGVIATNLHVVAGESEVTVELLDGRKLPVKQVLAFDMTRDLALLDLGLTKPMPYLRLGDSDAVSPGDPVVAIGNPLGVLSYTVSDGLISSVRKLGDELTVLQISAPISQGSSGGPLFNPYGEVVGVATAIFAGGQNLNFAVPSNYLKPMLDEKQPMTLAAFAKETSGGEDDVKIHREIPVHDVAILDKCPEDQIVMAAEDIKDAISIGAPLYNKGDFDACFEIYRQTSEKIEKRTACDGIRQAFRDGLARAAKLESSKEKAWALRDTFDGMLDVMVRKVQTQP